MQIDLGSDISVGVGGGAIQVTSGVQESAPVRWLRGHTEGAFMLAGAVAWVLGHRTVGLTLVIAGGALLLLEKTAPGPAQTVTLNYGAQ